MARAQTKKLYRSFVKGLVSEAGPLTYPEDSSYAEDNTNLFRKGNRSRRLGFDFEDDYSLSSYYVNDSDVDTVGSHTYKWESINEQADLNFLVHRLGSNLYFYDLASSSLSNGLKSFSIDLNTFLAPNASDVAQGEVSMAGGKGYLFVVGSKLEPFIVEYNPDNDTISTTRTYIQIRDFRGVDDGLANDEDPVTLSNPHKYNLMNQGWVDPRNTGAPGSVQYFDSYGGTGTYSGPTTAVISSYFTQFSAYPGNNKSWWVARDSTTGDFDPELLGKFFSGNNRAARGHFVVDAFYVDRSAISGVAGLPVEPIAERPPSVAFFSGRVWYVLNGTIYFSQVLDDKRKAGFCYQEADPTSEDISDLIATDGGVIPIPEMARGVKLVPMGGGLLVFGTNGIWYVSGTQAGFTATDISVSKINPIGTNSPDSIVEAEGQVFFWSKVGIIGLSQKSGMFGAVEGVFDRTNVTEQTIQSLYNDIPEDSKQKAKGVYDPATNTVQWLFRSGTTPGMYLYDRVLNLDMTLGAFYPWTVSTVGPYITGLFVTPTINNINSDSSIRSNFIKYLAAVPSNGTYRYTAGLFKSSTFSDWHTYDGVGQAYTSFLETGYELLEDAMRQKQAPYVFCYFRRTEDNFVGNEADDYTVDKPSSCYLQVKWDWSNSSASNRWSSKVQAYRFRQQPTLDVDNLAFDNGFPVVVTKNKVRGQGKAIQFRFESNEIGKDFDLLGWAVPYSGNTEP